MLKNTNCDLVLLKPGNPKLIYGALSNNLHAIEPPLWAILIAGYVRDKGYKVKVIDAEADELTIEQTIARIKEANPKLVGIIISGSNLSASTWNMPVASSYVNEMKDKYPDLKVFMWGLHPSALPERTLQEEKADFVIQGEGFHAVAELLENLSGPVIPEDFKISGLWYKKAEKIYSNSFPEIVKDLDALPMAAWDLLPMDKYRAHNWHCFDDLNKRSPYAVVFASLGCPFDCSFCALKALFGKPQVRYRSPQNFIEEIDLLVKNIKLEISKCSMNVLC